MPMFDPNAPMLDLASQKEALDRQALIAASLRKKADSAKMGDGQMIGGHFVGPHWTEGLADVMSNFNAAMSEGKYEKEKKDYGSQVNQAKTDWQSALPQTVAAIPGREELQGPQAEMGSPELAAVPDTPAQIPSRSSVLANTLKGMAIPGNEKAAEMWGKGMQDEQSREDTQLDKKETRIANSKATHDNLMATLAQRESEAQARLEDRNLSREQQAFYQKEVIAARREATAANDRHNRETEATARDKALKASDKPPPKHISDLMKNSYDKAVVTREMEKSFNPDYSGLTMPARVKAGQYIGTDGDAVSWWKDYKRDIALVQRHLLFGATLTPGEKQSWKDSDITEGMAPDVIQRNLKTRAKLAEKAYNKDRETSIALKHNSVADAYEPIFTPEDEPPPEAAPPAVVAAAPQALPASAPKAKRPVTKVIGGKTYVNPTGDPNDWELQ